MIIRADYLPDNPMDTPRTKFAETIRRSRQIINPRSKFISCGVNGLPSTMKKKGKNTPAMRTFYPTDFLVNNTPR
jgi:hypothetical protein